MRRFLASMFFGIFVMGLAGCTPKADTSRGEEQPLPKDGPEKLKGPPAPPPPPK
jgi:hypothetical protein